MVLQSMNGVPVKNMKVRMFLYGAIDRQLRTSCAAQTLVRSVGTSTEKFLRFSFEGQAGLAAGTEMVLERALVEQSTPEILATHRIPAAITPNLIGECTVSDS